MRTRKEAEDPLRTKQEKMGLSYSLKDSGRREGHFLVSDDCSSLVCKTVILVNIGEIFMEGRSFSFYSH